MVLSVARQGGQQVGAANNVALASGIRVGMMLTDAQALISGVPGLAVHDLTPERDDKALASLADWCSRYSPWVASDNKDGDYGICLDVTGCAHLFGGEASMLDDISRRLTDFSIQTQIAIADSLGAAWAIARYGVCSGGGATTAIVPSGGVKAALDRLPVSALRLSAEAENGLARLGLGRIGELWSLPRGALTVRFGREVVYRLDQALSRAPEPLSPRPAKTSFWSRMIFPEPIGHRDHIMTATAQLVDELCTVLESQERGARHIELRFYLANGSMQRIQSGLNRASREPEHFMRLLSEHLPSLEAQFGADLMLLIAGRSDPLLAVQRRFDNANTEEGLSPLLDRLGNRLGATNVVRFAPVQSHLPEQAVRCVPPLSISEIGQWHHIASRPVYLLPNPELVEVVAEVPDGLPMLFRWRGVAHRVHRGDGPERIAPEWWNNIQINTDHLANETRDYYRIEDSKGQRYWLFRQGLYKGKMTKTLDWFLHGFFA